MLILPTTQPEDIAQFGIRLAEAWKLGREARRRRRHPHRRQGRSRAAHRSGSTASKARSPTSLSSRIINDTIVPLFKQGDFYGGINAGVDQMIRVIDGEPLPAPDQSWKPEQLGGTPLPIPADRRR